MWGGAHAHNVCITKIIRDKEVMNLRWSEGKREELELGRELWESHLAAVLMYKILKKINFKKKKYR